jgi:hypothetical protein
MPPGGIRTHDPSKRAAQDPRLRPRGHWDRPAIPLPSRYQTYIQPYKAKQNKLGQPTQHKQPAKQQPIKPTPLLHLRQATTVQSTNILKQSFKLFLTFTFNYFVQVYCQSNMYCNILVKLRSQFIVRATCIVTYL